MAQHNELASFLCFRLSSSLFSQRSALSMWLANCQQCEFTKFLIKVELEIVGFLCKMAAF